MNLDPYELKTLMADIAELTANNIASKFGKLKDEISERAAFRRFGEGDVKRWVATGAVTRIKIGDRNSKITYSANELLAMQKAERQAKRQNIK
jgi:hypothetical protein